MTEILEIEFLGRIDYDAAWNMQKELVAARSSDEDLPDKLLLLEHPPTYTLGRFGDKDNLVFDEAQRREKGIALYRVDRGGDVTYHGPGQLVGYPILNLERLYGRGIGRIRRYVNDLESVLIQTLDTFDIHAQRFEGFRGVWVDQNGELNKIGAIGVYVNRKGISSHGFALNASTDLSFFDGIIPCGIDDHGVTSMSAQLKREVTILDVLPILIETIAGVFGHEPQLEGIPYAHR